MNQPPAQPPIHVVGAAIVRDGRCLVARRGPGMSAPMKWEFPGGKVEAGEAPKQALSREIREELGLEIQVGAWLGRGESEVDGRTIVLDVYLAQVAAGKLELREHCEHGWFSAAALVELDWAPADVPVLPALERALEAAEPLP